MRGWYLGNFLREPLLVCPVLFLPPETEVEAEFEEEEVAAGDSTGLVPGIVTTLPPVVCRQRSFGQQSGNFLVRLTLV